MITRLLFTAFIGVLPLTMMAQDDDMYFVPKKQAKQNVRVNDASSEYDRSAYYCGSNRDVDEYNRRGKLKSYYQKVGTDSLGNDIIEFHEGDGTYGVEDLDSTISIYPGSERYYDDADEDFACSRRIGRFDSNFFYDPVLYGDWSYPYWHGYYGWYDPWYAGSWYYPYAGWYGGWYSPWRYNYWAWNYPYWGWGGWSTPYVRYSYGGPTGTRNHSANRFGDSRFMGRNNNFGTTMQQRRGSDGFGTRRVGTRNDARQWNNNRSTIPSQPNNSFGSNRGSSFGGNFGGSRSGGFSGGSRGGGFSGGSRGGSFGSRR